MASEKQEDYDHDELLQCLKQDSRKIFLQFGNSVILEDKTAYLLPFSTNLLRLLYCRRRENDLSTNNAPNQHSTRTFTHRNVDGKSITFYIRNDTLYHTKVDKSTVICTITQERIPASLYMAHCRGYLTIPTHLEALVNKQTGEVDIVLLKHPEYVSHAMDVCLGFKYMWGRYSTALDFVRQFYERYNHKVAGQYTHMLIAFLCEEIKLFFSNPTHQKAVCNIFDQMATQYTLSTEECLESQMSDAMMTLVEHLSIGECGELETFACHIGHAILEKQLSFSSTHKMIRELSEHSHLSKVDESFSILRLQATRVAMRQVHSTFAMFTDFSRTIRTRFFKFIEMHQQKLKTSSNVQSKHTCDTQNNGTTRQSTRSKQATKKTGMQRTTPKLEPTCRENESKRHDKDDMCVREEDHFTDDHRIVLQAEIQQLAAEVVHNKNNHIIQ